MKKVIAWTFVLMLIYCLISAAHGQETMVSTKIQESIKKVVMEYVIFDDNISSKEVLNSNKEFNWNESLFIGDSLLVGLDNSNDIKSLGAKIDGKVGRPMSKGKDVASKYSGYKNVFVFLGTNDCGNNPKIFKTNMKKLINTVRENNPDAQIYVSTMPPINNSKAQKNGYKATNSMIEKNNKTIKEVIDEEFVNLIDSYDFLINNNYKTIDGIHMTNDTYIEWFGFIKDSIKYE